MTSTPPAAAYARAAAAVPSGCELLAGQQQVYCVQDSNSYITGHQPRTWRVRPAIFACACARWRVVWIAASTRSAALPLRRLPLLLLPLPAAAAVA